MTDFVMKELDWLRTLRPLSLHRQSLRLDGLMRRYERAVRALEAVLDEAAKAEKGALRWADLCPSRHGCSRSRCRWSCPARRHALPGDPAPTPPTSENRSEP